MIYKEFLIASPIKEVLPKQLNNKLLRFVID